MTAVIGTREAHFTGGGLGESHGSRAPGPSLPSPSPVFAAPIPLCSRSGMVESHSYQLSDVKLLSGAPRCFLFPWQSTQRTIGCHNHLFHHHPLLPPKLGNANVDEQNGVLPTWEKYHGTATSSARVLQSR